MKRYCNGLFAWMDESEFTQSTRYSDMYLKSKGLFKDDKKTTDDIDGGTDTIAAGNTDTGPDTSTTGESTSNDSDNGSNANDPGDQGESQEG